LSFTRGKNPAKLPLVGLFWASPGAKTREYCPWSLFSKNADFVKTLIQSTLQNRHWASQMHQGQKTGKTAPGGVVLSLTRGKNTGILPLVIIFKERRFYQMPHSEHLAKSSLGKPDAPGAKNRQNCPWWACFEPHHVQKHWESAPGGSLAFQS